MTIDVLSAAIKDTSASSGAPAWCIDADTRNNVIARRNILAALWAGRLMGLSDVTITTYAVEVHLADCEVRGDMVVVEKLTRDLNDRGLPIPAEVVHEKLCSFHREALLQTHTTD